MRMNSDAEDAGATLWREGESIFHPIWGISTVRNCLNGWCGLTGIASSSKTQFAIQMILPLLIHSTTGRTMSLNSILKVSIAGRWWIRLNESSYPIALRMTSQTAEGIIANPHFDFRTNLIKTLMENPIDLLSSRSDDKERSGETHPKTTHTHTHTLNWTRLNTFSFFVRQFFNFQEG